MLDISAVDVPQHPVVATRLPHNSATSPPTHEHHEEALQLSVANQLGIYQTIEAQVIALSFIAIKKADSHVSTLP